MPFKHQWEKHGFFVKLSGKVIEKDFDTKNLIFSNDPRCDKCNYQIIDGTEIEELKLSRNDFTKVASNDIGMSCYIRNLVVVLVGSNAELKSGYRHYLSTCKLTDISWSYHICETLEQAREWLKEQKADEAEVIYI